MVVVVIVVVTVAVVIIVVVVAIVVVVCDEQGSLLHQGREIVLYISVVIIWWRIVPGCSLQVEAESKRGNARSGSLSLLSLVLWSR